MDGVAYTVENDTHVSMRFDLHWGVQSLSLLEFWSAARGDVLYMMRTDKTAQTSCTRVATPTLEHPPYPGLCTQTELINMTHAGSTSIGSARAQLWTQTWPGFPGSQMPPGSVLNVSFEPVHAPPPERGARGAGGAARHALGVPLWHSLASPDGSWVVDHAVTDWHAHVDPAAFEVPDACRMTSTESEPGAAPAAWLVKTGSARGGGASAERAAGASAATAARRLDASPTRARRARGTTSGSTGRSAAGGGCPFARMGRLLLSDGASSGN